MQFDAVRSKGRKRPHFAVDRSSHVLFLLSCSIDQAMLPADKAVSGSGWFHEKDA